MKLRVLAVVLAAGVLGACTNADWDHALSYAGLGDSDKPAAEAQPQQAADPAPSGPVASAPAADNWCNEAAKAAATDAAEQGFDAATQQHRFQATYAQCTSAPASAVN